MNARKRGNINDRSEAKRAYRRMRESIFLRKGIKLSTWRSIPEDAKEDFVDAFGNLLCSLL